MNYDLRTPILGFLGGAGTWTLAHVNDAISFAVGVLTAAYLVRQHIAFRGKKK